MSGSDWKVVRITYWRGSTEYRVWWFSDQIDDAMRRLGAERWIIG